MTKVKSKPWKILRRENILSAMINYLSANGKLIASSNVSSTGYWVAPGEVHLYGADSGYPYALLRGHTKRVTDVDISADGKLLASGSADGSIRIWGVKLDESASISAPTVVPAAEKPAATSTSASWRDDFDTTLADGWRWVREHPDKWNLTDNPRFLRLYDSPYEVNGRTQNFYCGMLQQAIS